MRLGDLEFVDLYLGADFADIKGLAGSMNVRDPAPPELDAQIHELRRLCRYRYVAERDADFSLIIDKIVYRVTMMRDVSGEEVFILRRSNAVIRPIEQIGIAPKIVRELMNPDLKGLVLVVGETGAGKTSTAAAIFKARLERLGGIGITIEDPPEVNLNGVIGKGRGVQIRASRRTGGYKEHFVRTLRSNPDQIFLGEVREEVNAQEVLEASLTGHLILSTLHAGSIVDAIERLCSLAAGSKDVDAAYKKLSTGLKAVIWQNLIKTPGAPPRYKYEALMLTGEEASGARSKIASGKIRNLVQDIDMQMRRLVIDPMGTRQSRQSTQAN